MGGEQDQCGVDSGPVYIACIWYEPFAGFTGRVLHVVCDHVHFSMWTMLQFVLPWSIAHSPALGLGLQAQPNTGQGAIDQRIHVGVHTYMYISTLRGSHQHMCVDWLSLPVCYVPPQARCSCKSCSLLRMWVSVCARDTIWCLHVRSHRF
jgi:hypothetical protein